MLDNIAAQIARTRKDIPMSISKLSQLTGYSERNIYRYENGQLTPSLHFVATLAKLSGHTIDTIVGQ